MQRIAIVSEHASPLARLGGVDSGGQNVYVANVAREMARQGVEVDVFTRLDSAELPREVELEHNVRVVHVPAGPARHLPEEHRLPSMCRSGDFLQTYGRDQGRGYDVIPAKFFMSSMAAMAW